MAKEQSFALSEQSLSALALADPDKFRADVIRFVKKQLDRRGEEVEDSTIELGVGSGIRRARANGFASAHDIMTFVALMFKYAPDFDRHPEVRAILDDKSIPQETRMEALIEGVPDRAWDEVINNADIEAWFE